MAGGAGGMISLPALLTEINTDPNAFGYAALKTAGNDQGLADALNLPRAALPQVFIGLINPVAILRCIVRADFAALSSSDQNLILAIIQAGQVDSADANTRATFSGAFAGKQTLTNIQAIVQRNQSRAEQLFGVGTVVSANDVAHAFGRV